jgi:LSD1 subclass zinc finger protein
MKITTIQCPSCGAPLSVPEDAEQVRCEYCGSEQAIERKRLHEPIQMAAPVAPTAPTPTHSPSNQLTVFLLCFFLGAFGVHRFYTGHTVPGLIQLFTLGGFGVWWFIDLVLIGLGRYRDKQGLLLSSSNPALPRGCLFGLITSFLIFQLVSFVARTVSRGSEQQLGALMSTGFWAAVIVGVGVVIWVARKK